MSKHEFVWDGRGERGDDARFSMIAGRAASDRRLTLAHFRILAHLGRFNGKRGWCRLSQSDLAKQYKMQRSWISKVVHELVAWGYIQMRSQAESGESFCLYRTIIDDPAEAQGGVSTVLDTPATGSVNDNEKTQNLGGVSTVLDTPPKRRRKQGGSVVCTRHPCLVQQTPVSTNKDTLVGHGEHVGHQKQQLSPEAGSLLIPFEDTTVPSLLAAAADEVAKKEFGIDRLPLSPKTLRQIAAMCVDVPALVRRYLKKTDGGKGVDHPSAYLVTMALEQVAERDGVSAAEAKRLTTGKRPARAAAMAKALGADEPKKPSWRDRQQTNTNRSALAGALKGRTA